MQINGFTMPQGATHFCPAFGRYPNRAFRLSAGGWAKWTGFEWRDLPRSPTDSALSNMMALPAETSWNSEGAPPAGIQVEIKLKSTRADWCPATVLFCQDDALVIAWKAEGVARPTTLSAVDIRPIRTAEQIAAEERKAREAELATAIKVSGWESPEILAAYLDSHGYRKVEQ